MDSTIRKSEIKSLIQDHESLTKRLYNLVDEISEIAEIISSCIKQDGKVLWMGNGGSAADCQHLAAEFVGRFEFEREGLPAIALTTDTSILTAVSNDYGFESVFERQIEVLCDDGDIVIGISTSGESRNIIKACKKANARGAVTIGFTGGKEAPIDDIVQYCLKIPSTNTARIQEMHILCGHIICEMVEHSIFDF